MIVSVMINDLRRINNMTARYGIRIVINSTAVKTDLHIVYRGNVTEIHER